MALYSPLMSPGVFTREVDLTNGVPNVPSSTAVTVGNFRWGPVEEPVLINNEARLAKVFGNPDLNTSLDFHTASYYLRYSDDLYVIRKITEDANAGPEATFTTAIDSTGTSLTMTLVDGGGGYVTAPTAIVASAADSGDTPTVTVGFDSATGSVTGFTVVAGATPYFYDSSTTITIALSDTRAEFGVNAYSYDTQTTVPIVKNEANFEAQKATLANDGHYVVAKYPGEMGNGLRLSIVGAAEFASWPYKSYFDGVPGTSDYAALKGALNDEVHAVVVDENGVFTGTKGQVLEVFSYLSLARDAKDAQGSTVYIADVINNRSKYIWFVNFVAGMGVRAGTAAGSGDNYAFTGYIEIDLVNGRNSGALGVNEYAFGFDLIEDVNTYTVDFLIAPGMPTATEQTTVVNDLISIAQSTRKDCVVVASPSRASVINESSPVTQTITDIANFTRSSYAFIDNNYLRVYDKYNDQYIYIPAASSTAGIMAASDNNFAPWYSPAGTRRGQYLGVTSLAYSPNNSERDELYKAGVNPISNIPGQGILLYGDKTHLARPSAFDRINVRRLFLVLERAISQAAANILFEFNDEFTRAEFVNIVEPVLRDVKGRRGITDFLVVCDETNNTPEIIDTNQFVASLFIKPARSINFITLNFVAVRTGVSFEEVVGNGNAGV